MQSILAKANAFMNSAEGKKREQDYISRKMYGSVSFRTDGGSTIHPPEEAAKLFIDVLWEQILSSLTTSAAESITSSITINHTEPIQIGDNVFEIGIDIDGDLHRESLAPEKYGGVDNIVALLNNGYDTGHIVWGQWHGNRIHSLQSRSGASFIQDSVNAFRESYAKEYGVIDIEVDEIYT